MNAPFLIRQPGGNSRALGGTETGAGFRIRPVRIPARTTRNLPDFQAIPGDADCPATSTGAPRLCDQGPVSRASTLRSSVPETLPDGSQHWGGYLRLIAD